MKTIIVLLLSIFFIGKINAQKGYQLPSNITSNDYMAKTIIIKVKPALASACSVNKIENQAFQAFASAVGVTNLHKNSH